MTSAYFLSLAKTEQLRYLQKLKIGDNVELPDPLNQILRRQLFTQNVKRLPEVAYPDLCYYLVETECVYTREAVKAYRSLDAYNYFLSGKIANICSYNVDDVYLVFGEVGASQTLSKTYSAWFVAKVTGEVVSKHCTCMAGLSEVCRHVSAILVAVEQCVREGLNAPSVTSESCVWSRINKKTLISVVDRRGSLISGDTFSTRRIICDFNNMTGGLRCFLYRSEALIVSHDSASSSKK